MAEQQKKPVATTSKAGWWIAGLFLVIIIILVLSGFRKVNPFLLMFLLLVLGVVIVYWMKRPKQLDYAQLVKKIQQTHYREFNYGIDIRNFQVLKAASMIYVFFPYEAKTFGYDISSKLITEVEINHPYPILKRQEKSRLFELAQRHLGAEAKLRGIAESLNVDVGLNE